MTSNTMTILRCAPNKVLAKRFKGTGTTDCEPYDKPAYFVPSGVPVHFLDDWYRLLANDLQHDFNKCVIRGKFVGQEAAAEVRPRVVNGKIQHPTNGKGGCRRWLDIYMDTPMHLVMFDIDNFVPQTADPVLKPKEAIIEWTR